MKSGSDKEANVAEASARIAEAAAAGVTHRLLERRLPAAEQIYGHLREEIITCRLAPNEALSENRICGIFIFPCRKANPAASNESNRSPTSYGQ